MANNLHHELLDGCYVRMLGGGKKPLKRRLLLGVYRCGTPFVYYDLDVIMSKYLEHFSCIDGFDVKIRDVKHF